MIVVRNRIGSQVAVTNVDDHTNNVEPNLSDVAAPRKKIPKAQPRDFIFVTDGGFDP